MNLHRLLLKRQSEGKPIRVAVIGAGKFGSMYLHQAPRTPGMVIHGIADLSPPRAREALARIGWDAALIAATPVTEDALSLIADPQVEVVVEATGDPAAGLYHARHAIRHGKHVVMVNVEADVLAGPVLAREAEAAGVVYSMAYGDQPALVAEMVDTIRAAGFSVIAAGKGTKYLPRYHASTPETVWDFYGLTAEQARAGGMNPRMFNSFLDGTKSGIEMAAIANACALAPPEDGLLFPPCGTAQLPNLLRPHNEGGVLPRKGMVEVVSSLTRDGADIPDNLRWGVYVVFEGETEYARRCFSEYGVATDNTGRYAALWRPYHFIGLELGVSVASAALRREPTGCSTSWTADCVAVAKRPLRAGEVLDGEGGATVWGKCIPASRSRATGAVPIGLAHGVALARDVAEGAMVTEADLAPRPGGHADEAIAMRAALAALAG
ncbi:flagellar biosynthesis protein FlgA [Falsiroseomonas bella]|uniref:Flagellar biosynthesis protein FlgA n=1 Tax=Falsiroseomonas bella TaxID=2184016 RepID=A0A317FIU3_9PROT|nr:Gfo/Idh/MocA family oxidoreductase [Falsiroseomonas bella]PWS37496.1 flagellar biosynthesis protein FlgA [Falsiroseomonas bella]